MIALMSDKPVRKGAPEGNQNAAKDDALDDTLTIRIKGSERAGYMAIKGLDADGKPKKLARWIRETLNKAAGLPPPGD